ncbi:hypothetical protein PsYK624_011540 [Phanerochaete sordida]|uniref:F-box domain-containing protein n=1 Tax=Phanerochaete sordida TaxID=48140 RepID=A0A9P3L8V7_9APHY|nr:hypothetical protein PsYK624_011540 [Phanerochaete sordida]
MSNNNSMPILVVGHVNPQFSADWQSVLEHRLGHHQILPHLKSLDCNVESDAEQTRIFLAPPLRELNIDYYSYESIRLLLEYLPSCARTLQILEINTWQTHEAEDDFHHIAFIARTMSSLRSLVQLSMDALSLGGIAHLAVLPNLKVLAVRVCFAPEEQQSKPPLPLSFPSLQTAWLEVRFAQFLDLMHVIHCMVAPKLHHLTLEFCTPLHGPQPSPQHMHDMFKAVETLPTVTSLEMFDSSGDDDPLAHWHTAFVDSASLSHLFALRNMTTLSLYFVPFRLSPSDIAAMASAWPNIRTLELGGYTLSPALRVEDLLPLALHCPELRTLWLNIAISERGGLRREIGPVRSTSQLTKLDVGMVPMQFSPHDAGTLAVLFPQATIVSSETGEVGVVGSMNATIREMVGLLERQRELYS